MKYISDKNIFLGRKTNKKPDTSEGLVIKLVVSST